MRFRKRRPIDASRYLAADSASGPHLLSQLWKRPPRMQLPQHGLIVDQETATASVLFLQNSVEKRMSPRQVDSVALQPFPAVSAVFALQPLGVSLLLHLSRHSQMPSSVHRTRGRIFRGSFLLLLPCRLFKPRCDLMTIADVGSDTDADADTDGPKPRPPPDSGLARGAVGEVAEADTDNAAALLGFSDPPAPPAPPAPFRPSSP